MTRPFDLSGDNPWQTVSSDIVYDNGRLRLYVDDVLQPDGEPGRYAYLEIPWPVVAVVPISDAGEVYLVRQWRYPWAQNSWEIPAGHGEPNEDPLQGAQRELAEEVGLQAASWEQLGTGFATASMNSRYHLYLARGLSSAQSPHALDGAEHDLVACRVPLKDAIEAAMDGRIEHSMSVVGLLRAARRLGL